MIESFLSYSLLVLLIFIRTKSHCFAGKFYNYDSYDKVYQDVLAWVVKASDELKAMDEVGQDLQTVNIQSETTFKYLEDLNKFHHAIGEVRMLSF